MKMRKRSSVPLAKAKLFEAARRIPLPELRAAALKRLREPVPYRHGSRLFKNHHPVAGVSDEEKGEMAKEKAVGLSFREIEGIHRLYPCNGNDAYRCINDPTHGILKRRPDIRKECRLIRAEIKKRAVAVLTA